MTRVAVLDDYQRVAASLADWHSLGPDVAVEFFHDHLFEEDRIAERLQPFDAVALMRERTPFPASLLARLPKLRLLITTGSRNRSVDLDACARAGITVCTTRGGGPGTAELTWGLILGLARGIAREDRALREGRWQTSIGIELAGKTLGILGLGRLGAAAARIGRAFGMHPIAWSQNLTAERAAECGAERVDKHELFARADFLTIHLVLGARTRGIVGAAELARMKPTAYLVNTSRGPIVDSRALVAALEAGTIAGAALDVFDTEPLPLDDPLLRAPNTLFTPHVGYVTQESYASYFPDIVENLKAWRAGAPIRVLRA